MLTAFFPLTFVDCAICPIHFAIPISLIVNVIAFVHITAFPGEDAVSVLFVHGILALIVVTIRLVALTPLPFAMLEASLEITDIETSALPLVLAEALRLSITVLSLISVAISEEIRSMAMLETIFPLALISAPVIVLENSRASNVAVFQAA
jgi:hypothetical protein